MRFISTILGDDIFRTLQRIENNQPFYTTLIGHTHTSKQTDKQSILIYK